MHNDGGEYESIYDLDAWIKRDMSTHMSIHSAGVSAMMGNEATNRSILLLMINARVLVGIA